MDTIIVLGHLRHYTTARRKDLISYPGLGDKVGNSKGMADASLHDQNRRKKKNILQTALKTRALHMLSISK